MAGAPRGLAPGLAALLTGAGFFALLIAGFGVLSLLTDAEVLPVSGLGQAPGALGTAAALGVYVWTAWLAARRPRASYASVGVVVVATFLAYLCGVVVGGFVSGVDPARAVAAAGGFAISWFAVVLASAALLAAWTAIAFVRTGASRPRWPWEGEAP